MFINKKDAAKENELAETMAQYLTVKTASDKKTDKLLGALDKLASAADLFNESQVFSFENKIVDSLINDVVASLDKK